MLVFMRMSLASLYNHLCHFQSENVFQTPVTLPGKTIFDIQGTISLKNRRFHEKKCDEIDDRRYPYRGSTVRCNVFARTQDRTVQFYLLLPGTVRPFVACILKTILGPPQTTEIVIDNYLYSTTKMSRQLLVLDRALPHTRGQNYR